MAVLVEKPNREELRKSIKLYAWYKKSFYEGEAWMKLDWNGVNWRACMNTAMNVLGSIMAVEFIH